MEVAIGGEPGDDSNDDAEVMDWLQRVLAVPVRDRPAVLEELQRQRPALAERVHRLVGLADERGNTRLIADAFGIPSDQAAEALPGKFEGYRLIQLLGQGGMALVWRAWQITVGREVAIKVPRHVLADSSMRARFELEREVLCRLDHAGIAKLFDAGVSESGHPFIVLEYIDGTQVDKVCDEGRRGLHERLNLFRQILDAVDHAHKRGIVHRDLKPSNILVDDSGRVRLLDFGIAKLLQMGGPEQGRTALTGGRTAPTLLNDHPGTLRYAAPEQLEGGEITVGTDVYALGVVLFELVTGVSPYGEELAQAEEEAKIAELVRHVLQIPAPRPSVTATEMFAVNKAGSQSLTRWQASLRGDLDTIILKALQKQATERYGSIESFRKDIESFLERRPIEARPPSAVRRFRLWVQRNRALSAVGLTGTLAALVLGGIAAAQFAEAIAQGRRAEQARDFMFAFVNDAEVSEKRRSEPTGREMLASAVTRANERFAKDPGLRGEVMAELARMTRRLDALGSASRAATQASQPASAAALAPQPPQTAEQLLRNAIDLLQKSRSEGDPALNKARAYLADELISQGRTKESQELATEALESCKHGRGCAKARFYARGLLSRLDLLRGDVPSGTLHAQLAVADSEIGFGDRDPETSLARLALAITLRQAGRLDEARTVLDAALEATQGFTLRQADRVAMLRFDAVLNMDLGEFAKAESQITKLLPQDMGNGEATTLRRVLATVQLALGMPESARTAADWVIGRSESSKLERALSQQVRGRAYSLLGQEQQALEDIGAGIAGMQGLGYTDKSMEALRARRFVAEVKLRAGRLTDGLALLTQLLGDHAALGARHELELAQTLDLAGSALRHFGNLNAAAEAHGAAARILSAKLRPGHPTRHRNELYAAAASTPPNDVAASESLRRLAAAYAERFPATSVWRSLIAQRLFPLTCAPEAYAACGLYL